MHKSAVVHIQLELIKLKFFPLWNSFTECSKNESNVGPTDIQDLRNVLAFLSDKRKKTTAVSAIYVQPSSLKAALLCSIALIKPKWQEEHRTILKMVCDKW